MKKTEVWPTRQQAMEVERVKEVRSQATLDALEGMVRIHCHPSPGADLDSYSFPFEGAGPRTSVQLDALMYANANAIKILAAHGRVTVTEQQQLQIKGNWVVDET